MASGRRRQIQEEQAAQARREAQDVDDVYIPVRLSDWDRDKIEIHSLADVTGAIAESAEFFGTKGKKIFAIEDGEITIDAAENRINLIANDQSDGLRSWSYLNVRESVSEGPVQAGQEIGTVFDNDLVLLAFTSDSVSVPVGTDERGNPVSQKLSVDPLSVLDRLDVMPLPQDQTKVLTVREKKELSEDLTDAGIQLSRGWKIGLGIAGVVGVTALAVKAFSK